MRGRPSVGMPVLWKPVAAGNHGRLDYSRGTTSIRTTRTDEGRDRNMARPIIDFPANVPCPACGGLVQDWHTEWTDPAYAPDFYKGLRALDCPLCRGWVLHKQQK